MRQAERRAATLLNAHHVVQAPIPVEELARRRGAEIRYRVFDDDVSGLLLREGTSKVIGVNSAHPKTRQRFTIAHELGHLELHPGERVIVEHLSRVRVNWRDGTSGLATDAEEIEANQYAAALLMPDGLIEQDFWPLVRQHPPDVIVERLSKRYQVSSQAMRFRLVNLALIDPV